MKAYEEARKMAATVASVTMCLAEEENDHKYENGVVKGIASGLSIAYDKDPNEVMSDIEKVMCDMVVAGFLK